MSPLEQAILRLEIQLADLGVGSVQQPEPMQSNWYLMRAVAIGLSALREMKEQELTTEAEVEQFYRRRIKEVKSKKIQTPE